MLTGQVVQAVGLFAVTNIDDIVILALFFSRTADRPVVRCHRRRPVPRVRRHPRRRRCRPRSASALLPEAAIPYFGLLPLLLGLRAGWQAWRDRGQQPDDETAEGARTDELGVLSVAQ